MVPFLGELVGLVVGQPAQAGAVVQVVDDVRGVAQAVVRLAEAVVVRAPDQLRDRLAVAVRRVQVAPWIDRNPEWIHLPACKHFQPTAIGAKAEGVSAVHGHFVAVLALHLAVVGEAVAGIHPAVGHQGVAVGHAVGVAVAEAFVQRLTLVGLAVAIGIGEFQDPAALAHDHALAVAQRQHADWYVQFVVEHRHFLGFAVLVEVAQHNQFVGALAGFRCPRVVVTAGHPQSALGVVGHLHRLVDVRLAGHKLGRETGRQLEALAFLVRRLGLGLRHEVLGLDGQRVKQQQEETEAHRCVSMNGGRVKIPESQSGR